MTMTTMNYLIDTHILIWHAEESKQLEDKVLEEINSPDNAVYASHATFWEITIKLSVQKLTFRTPVAQFKQLAERNSFEILGFDFSHYNELEVLPFYHRDPFDRMLIAQAIAEDYTIITHDERFAAYEPSVKVLWN